MATNKRNVMWFEAQSMRALYEAIDRWQGEHQKRFLSLNVERDGDRFCCIALTNAAEVIIVDGESEGGVDVRDNALKIWS